METQTLIQVILPLVVILISWGIGLSLTVEDFRSVQRNPKLIGAGLLAQVLVTPVFAISIAFLFEFTPELSLGMLLLGVAPSGAAAVMFSHLAGGNVAFNVSHNSINSVLGIFTLPLACYFGSQFFLENTTEVPFQFQKAIEIFVILLAPTGMGIWMNYKFPSLSQKLEKPVKIISMIFLVALIVFGFIKELDLVRSGFLFVGGPILLLNILVMGTAAGIAIAFQLGLRDRISMILEVGVQKSALPISLAMSERYFNSSEAAMPAIVYTLVMYMTAGLFTWASCRRLKKN